MEGGKKCWGKRSNLRQMNINFCGGKKKNGGEKKRSTSLRGGKKQEEYGDRRKDLSDNHNIRGNI